MGRKGHGEEAEKENSERWLLTYADLITLLLALFIIMYAMSSVDQQKYKIISQSLSAAFNTPAAGEGNGPGTGQTDSTEGGGNDASQAGYSGQSPINSTLDLLYAQLNQYVKENKLENTIGLEKTSTYVRVTVKDILLFKPDSATMLQQSKPVLLQIEKAISGVYKDVDHVTISGHTADPANNQYYSSNFAWALSTQRAVTVLQYMVEQGLPQNKLSIEGYSHFVPIADNKTAKGRAQNRRVEITITKKQTTTATTTTTGSSATSESSTAGTGKVNSTGEASDAEKTGGSTSSESSKTAESSTASESKTAESSKTTESSSSESSHTTTSSSESSKTTSGESKTVNPYEG